MEAVNAQLLQDQKYWSLIEQAAEFWVDGSTEDSLVTLID